MLMLASRCSSGIISQTLQRCVTGEDAGLEEQIARSVRYEPPLACTIGTVT
jgi:hypothetical protein